MESLTIADVEPLLTWIDFNTQKQGRYLSIDLSNVATIDQEGVEALVVALRKTRQSCCDLALHSPNNIVKTLLERKGLLHAFSQ